MEAARQNRKCHVLLIYRKMIPSVRLCGHSQLSALAELGLLEYRAVRAMRLKAEDLNWADTVFLGRLDNWYEFHLSSLMKRSGKRLIYILDDDLLNIPGEISSASYYGQRAIQDYIRQMIGMSDGILSPSVLLLEKYATGEKLAMKTEEPALEAVPYRPHAPGQTIRIGFAGSIDRTADLEGILRDALLRVKGRYGERVAFEFFGAVPAFAGELGAKCVPYTDSYDAYRRQLNALEWDIGLAPMPVTAFHACKHYNKFCEYAAAGVAGIYTDCPPYTFIPRREVLGRFCPNDSQAWYERLCEEIEDDVGREERRRLCADFAAKALNPTAIGRELFEAWPGVFEPVESVGIRGTTLLWLKLNDIPREIAEKARRHKLRLPLVIAGKLLARLRARSG